MRQAARWLVPAAAAALGAGWWLSRRMATRVERQVPAQGRWVEVSGSLLHVVDAGPRSAPTLLLVHGLSGQLRHFTYGMVERLAADHRVIALDRPGAGYSVRAPGASAALPVQADLLAELLLALDVRQPVLVAGHSMGGAVALALALRHPARVAALALIAPLSHDPGRGARAGARSLRRPWLRHGLTATLGVPLTLLARGRVVRRVFGPEPMPFDYGVRGGGLLALRPSHLLGTAEDFAALHDALDAMAAQYPMLRPPLRVLYGRSDRLLDWRSQGQRLVDAVPGARLTLVDGGHMLPVTQPAATAAFVAGVALEAFGTPESQARSGS